MTEISARLALPYLQPNQAQKHVTHNAALGRLDILVQLTLEALGVVTPPVSPAEGAVWGLGAAPTGAWAGQAGALAAWVDGGWLFFVPQTGWRAWARAEGGLFVHTGGVWTAVGGSGSVDLDNVPGVGINTSSDPVNRLAVASEATLLTHAGAGHQVKVNKAAAGDTASLLYQTGFSGRAEMGLAGNDDFSVKVSPNGSAFAEAIRIDRASGRVELPQPVILPALSTLPAPPAAGKLALYSRTRAGAAWIDVQRPSGRDFPLQPHFGVNRIATWAPSISTTVNTHGVSRTAVGTVSTPTLTATNLASSMRRWRMTSAATANAVAEERPGGWVCWRGNAAGLGGFSYVNRLAMVTLQPTGTAIFGLIGSISGLSAAQTLATLVNAIGIGFDRGTHANWQILHNDGTGAPTLIDLGASFPVTSTTNVLTLYIAAAPNAAEVGVRVVEEVSGAVAEVALSTDLPAVTQFLSPRNFLSNGATAAAVAYDCSGLYIETDY
jgi:hypothetical protein